MELPWTADPKKRPVTAIRPEQPAIRRGVTQPTAIQESPSLAEPIRQINETRSMTEAAKGRTTLVRAGTWRTVLAHSRQMSGTIVHSRDQTTDNAPDASAKDTAGETPRRVLQWRHFETALSEISPSSTEDGTLPELRKVCLFGPLNLTSQWAEQYGDGGSKRSPRKGFGKSFGFSNLSQGLQSRYGQVKVEDE